MPISPPAARLPSCDTSRATAAKSSPPRTRRSAASARSRRSPTTAWVAFSGTSTMIWAMLNWALAPRAATLLDQGVDLGVADPDPARDLALAHPLDHHLVLDVGAELRVLDAFAAQPLAQLRQGELVLRGDVGDGPVELGLVDPHAALARVGDEHALVDQHVDHLLAQRRRRRQLGAGLLRLGAHPGEPLLHLGRRDQLLVDHGDDVVAGLRRRRARRARPSASAAKAARARRRADIESVIRGER